MFIKPAFFKNRLFIYINLLFGFIYFKEKIMQRIAACEGEWIITREDSHREEILNKALATVLGIVQDTLVMSAVVLAVVAVTLFV
jgi:hypothetical protein